MQDEDLDLEKDITSNTITEEDERQFTSADDSSFHNATEQSSVQLGPSMYLPNETVATGNSTMGRQRAINQRYLMPERTLD